MLDKCTFFTGKFIVGYMPICGEKEYYIGCACGELFAPPSAYVSMYGLTVQASFLGGKLIYGFVLFFLYYLLIEL